MNRERVAGGLPPLPVLVGAVPNPRQNFMDDILRRDRPRPQFMEQGFGGGGGGGVAVPFNAHERLGLEYEPYHAPPVSLGTRRLPPAVLGQRTRRGREEREQQERDTAEFFRRGAMYDADGNYIDEADEAQDWRHQMRATSMEQLRRREAEEARMMRELEGLEEDEK